MMIMLPEFLNFLKFSLELQLLLKNHIPIVNFMFSTYQL